MTTTTKSRPSRKTANPPPQASEPAEMDQDRPSQDRQAMIAEAAFFIAESRGFMPGQEFDDWLAAERTLERQQDSSVY